MAAVMFVLYGLFGFLLLAISASTIAQPLDDIDELTVSLEDQRAAVVRSLDQTATTIHDAAQGIANVNDSLDQARVSSEHAAGLARDVAGTMGLLAVSIDVTVFGVRPFEQVVPAFQQASQQLGALGTDLDGIAQAIGQNSEDARITAANLERLEQTIGELNESVAGVPSLEVSSDSLASIRLALFGLIAWLVILCTGIIGLGLGIWRWAGARS